ncbi:MULTISPECIES: universal stress protein [Gordonia]|uniref:Universal stress protein n=1 Tax=Gordonia terrae C-6 TaxID=1316928 RepID=R7YAA9_9ACTN|nr:MULTISPECIES: universal stress protein [Gordonia]EON32935.1 universal stress protein [Gordonia terrae C-6]
MSVVLSYLPTPEGRGALPFGFAEARMRGTDVVVVADGDDAASPQFLIDLKEARDVAAAGEVDYRVAENDPGLSHADQLIDASYDDAAELLVIGQRRRSPVGKLLTGSVVQRVLLDAQCPVVAVKPPVRAAV